MDKNEELEQKELNNQYTEIFNQIYKINKMNKDDLSMTNYIN